MIQPAPKNILYVENGIGYGGAIICLRHLVRNLDRARFNPMVITGRTGPQYQEIANEASWKWIPDRKIELVGLQAKIDSTQWMNKIPGFRFIMNQILARTDDVANFLPFLLTLLWTAWRFKADLIHANNEPLCNRAALLVGKVLHIPSICHIRGNQDGSRLMTYSYSLPDHFISVSNWVAQNVHNKIGVPDNKISVIYDGLELEKLDINADGQEFRKQFNIPKQSFTVGLVGLLIPWKGQELFIDAAKLLQEKIPHLKMLIVGGTPDDCRQYEKKLKQRVIDENLADTVVFTGHVTQMEAVYNGLDVVVSASTQPEPLGTMVIESLALGRPLIGPNHGGAAEMIEHEKTGLLFEHGNAEALASMIINFQSHPLLRKTLGTAARIHALKTFSVEEHVKHVQTVYEQFLVLPSK